MTQKITGVQRNAYELTKHLLPLLEDVTVLVPKQEINKGYDVKNWPVQYTGRFKGLLWEQTDLPLYLVQKKNKPLLVNLTNSAPLTYPHQVVSVMDMTTFINPAWFDKKFARYYQWLIPKIVRKAKVVFTISRNSQKDIARFTGVDERKIRVVYCGISDIFLSDTVPPSTIMEKLKLKQQGYFLAVSSLDPRKNFNKLIEAFTGLKTTLPLVIVGSKGKVFGDAKLDYSKIDSSRIIFTDYVSDADLKSLYRSSLCFIYPSLYEGFGIPPLEAMANGCPTIVSNTSSLPEVCGNASLYVDPYDQESITNAIGQIIKNKAIREELIKNGYENVKRFNWQRSAAKAMEQIQSVA